MILIDWPLGIAALVFFGISWLYGWGLTKFFGDDPERGRWFLWDWASVCGIFFTASLTYVFVLLVRKAIGWELTWGVLEQVVWDLFVMFAAALLAMRRVRIKLVERRQRWYAELVQLRKERNYAYRDIHRELIYLQQKNSELREENKVLQEQLEAKKNCEQRWKEQNNSLKAVLRIYEAQLNISPTDIISPPAQPEWLNVS